MTKLASVSLSREHQEYRACMVGPLTISLTLDLVTLTGSHMLCDGDAYYSPRAKIQLSYHRVRVLSRESIRH